jgi:hypothetical protein
MKLGYSKPSILYVEPIEAMKLIILTGILESITHMGKAKRGGLTILEVLGQHQAPQRDLIETFALKHMASEPSSKYS